MRSTGLLGFHTFAPLLTDCVGTKNGGKSQMFLYAKVGTFPVPYKKSVIKPVSYNVLLLNADVSVQ